jgi:hypothetical protein
MKILQSEHSVIWSSSTIWLATTAVQRPLVACKISSPSRKHTQNDQLDFEQGSSHWKMLMLTTLLNAKLNLLDISKQSYLQESEHDQSHRPLSLQGMLLISRHGCLVVCWLAGHFYFGAASPAHCHLV